jgi:GNAT superfamily N-acetyltransferase
MIRELTWDSHFFGRKIGELSLQKTGPDRLPHLLQQARKQGFEYLTCKTATLENSLIRDLETHGFTLVDIGITWAINTGRFLSYASKKPIKNAKGVRVAEDRDIPMLKKMTTSLFSRSRFYRDPFFTRTQANSLYRTWIENSVRGEAADIVYIIPETGLVTCKKTGKGKGAIVLIGVTTRARGKRLGTSLLHTAMKWFHMQGIHNVQARTQLNNLNAMNFYPRSGFSMKRYDLIFRKTF